MIGKSIYAAMLAGCVQVGPKEFSSPDGIGIISRGGGTAPTEVREESACPHATDFPPIPETVHIAIEPGKPVTADAGGRFLLRAYINARGRR